MASSFSVEDIDITKDALERTRGDDDFWDNASEHNLLSSVFVSNECQDAIPPPFQTMWTLGQERTDYKFSFMDDDDLSQGVVEAALEGIARSCVAPPSSSSFYFTFHRRLRLLRRMLSAAVRSRERVRHLIPICGISQQLIECVLQMRQAAAPPPAASAPPPPPPPAAKSAATTPAASSPAPAASGNAPSAPPPDPFRELRPLLAQLSEENISSRLASLVDVLTAVVTVPGCLQALTEQNLLDQLERLLAAHTPEDDNAAQRAFTCVLLLGVGRGSLKAILHALETLLSAHLLSPPSSAPLRLLNEYRNHFDLAAPTEAAFLGAWRYHSVAPQSKRKTYVSSSGAAMASDGAFLYVLNKEGLLKIGSGLGGTVPSFVYAQNADYRVGEKGWLAYAKGRLVYRSTSMDVGKAVTISCVTLQEERAIRFPHAAGVFPPNYLAALATLTEAKLRSVQQLRDALLADEPTTLSPLPPAPAASTSSTLAATATATAAPPPPPATSSSSSAPASPSPASSSSSSSSSSNAAALNGANVVLTGDGTCLYLLSETVVEEKAPLPPPSEEKKDIPPPPAAPKKGEEKKEAEKKPAATATPSPVKPPPTIKKYFYRVAKYTGEAPFTLLSVVELQPLRVIARHDQIVCEGCQRANFAEQRHKCTVCNDYNLCHLCAESGVLSKAHKASHSLTAMPFPEKDSPSAPPLSSEALLKGIFYTNGVQLAVLLAPAQSPSTLRRKHCVRLFSLADGAHIADVCVENPYNAATVCYDATNELLWANAPDNWSIARWAHHGSPSGSTSTAIVPARASSAAASSASPFDDAATSIVETLHVLATKASPCRRSRITALQPFAIDVSRESIGLMTSVLRLASVRLEEALKSSASATTSSDANARALVTHTLQLLRANVYHAVRLSDSNVLSDLSVCFASLKQQLLSLLAALPPSDALVTLVHDVLLGGMKGFYATSALQVLWAMDLMRTVDAAEEQQPHASAPLLARLLHKFSENPNLAAHFWPAPVADASSLSMSSPLASSSSVPASPLTDSVPLGALLSHVFRALQRDFSRDSSARASKDDTTDALNAMLWEPKRVQQWLHSRRYRESLQHEFFARLDGRALLSVNDTYLRAAMRSDAPKEAGTALLADIESLRTFAVPALVSPTDAPLAAPLRLLVSIQRDLVSRVSLNAPSSAAATRFLTYASALLEQSAQVLLTLAGSALLSRQAAVLEAPSVLSVLVPVLLLQLSLLCSSPDFASPIVNLLAPFSVALDALHRRAPVLFDAQSPAQLSWLVDLERITAHLTSALLVSLYNGDPLRPEENSHRNLIASPFIAAPRISIDASTATQYRAWLSQLIASASDSTDSACARFIQWLQARAARTAPLPASIDKHVSRSQRAYLAAALWTQRQVAAAMDFAARLTSDNTAQTSAELTTLIGASTQLRIWLTNTARKSAEDAASASLSSSQGPPPPSASQSSNAPKHTDESLATHFTEVAELLLAYAPPSNAPALPALESLFTSLLPAAAISAVLALRSRRCGCRAQAISALADVVEKSTSAAMRLECLRLVAPIARGRYLHFLLDDVYGAPEDKLESLKRSYARLFACLVAPLRDAAANAASPQGAPSADGSAPAATPAPTPLHCPTGHLLVFQGGRPYRCDLCSTSHPDAPHWWCPPCDYDCCHSCQPPPTTVAPSPAPSATTQAVEDDAYIRRLLSLNVLAQRLTPDSVDAASLCTLMAALWAVTYGPHKGALPSRIEVASRAVFTALANVALQWPTGQGDALKSQLLSLFASYLRAYTERTEGGLLDDGDALDVLWLLFHHRRCDLVCVLLVAQHCTLLSSLVQHSTPRLQRLALRLYHHALRHASASFDGAARTAAVASLFSLLGSALLDSCAVAQVASTPTSPQVSSSGPLVSTSGGNSTDDKAPHILIVYSVAGMNSADFVKVFGRASLPRVRTRDIAAEATDVGQSVVFSAPLDECLDAAKKLAALGFVCLLVPLPPTAAPVSPTVSNAALLKSPLRTPHISAALASELIALLRLLARIPEWSADISSSVQQGIDVLPALVAADAPKARLVSALSALALCGAFHEPLRIGGAVRSPSAQEGTIVEITGASARLVLRHGEERSFESIDLSRLTPLSAVPRLALPSCAALVRALPLVLSNSTLAPHLPLLASWLMSVLTDLTNDSSLLTQLSSSLDSSAALSAVLRAAATDFAAPSSGRTAVGVAGANTREVPRCWNAAKATQCVFIGADRRRVQLIGKDNEDSAVVADVPIPSSADEFYFEIMIETPADAKATVRIGMCPAEASPAWGACVYEYLPTGHKASPPPRDNSPGARLYACPYCGQEELSGRELCHHARQRHSNCTSLPVVCPLCAASPFGDPAQVSANFFSHIQNRHNDLLKLAAVRAVEAEYAEAYINKDIIGCGYRRADGSIYFTRNGKFLGSAFIGVFGRLLPYARLIGGGAALCANFGNAPFACDVSKAAAQDAAQREKLKAENEAKRRKEREEAEAKLTAKQELGKMLQSFVGFPLDFCMLALEQSNGNLEAAASWALENFERHISAAPPVARPHSPSGSPLSGSLTSSNTTSSSSGSPSITGAVHLALPYALTDASTSNSNPSNDSDASSGKSSRIKFEEAAEGQRVQLVETAASYFATWSEALVKKVGQSGVVTRVDALRLLARVRFEDDERGTQEEAWLPLRALTPISASAAHAASSALPPARAASALVSVLSAQPSLLSSSLCTTEAQLRELFSALSRTVFAPASYAAQSYVRSQLAVRLRDLCGAAKFRSLLYSEATRQLEEALGAAKLLSVQIESEHPSLPMDAAHSVQFPAPAAGYHVAFSTRTRLSARDALVLSSGEFVRTLRGGDAATYQPLCIPSNAALSVRFMPRDSQRQHLWGWRARISPLLPSLTLASWLLSDVWSHGGSVEFAALCALLEPHVLNTDLPEHVRQTLFRLAIALINSAPAGSPPLFSNAATASLITELSERLEGAIDAEHIALFLQDLVELVLALVRTGPSSAHKPSPHLARLVNGDAALRWLHSNNTRSAPAAPLPSFIVEQSRAELAKVPPRPAGLLENGALSVAARAAFVAVFLRFDADKDGKWSPAELSAYVTASRRTAPVPAVPGDAPLDVSAFLAWRTKEATSDVAALWNELYALGFDASFNHTTPTAPDAFASITVPPQEQAELDSELVAYVSLLSERLGIALAALHPAHLSPSSLLSAYARLAQLPLSVLRHRFLLLKHADAAAFALVPYINLSVDALASPGSLATLLCAARSSLFFESKMRFVSSVLDASATTLDSPTVRIDRVNDRTPVFLQLFNQLSSVTPPALRQKQRAFKVVLKNERVEGEVGPYREVLSQLCVDLQSNAVPLLVPCPNRQQAQQSVGIGDNRDKFILRPSLFSSSHLSMLEHFGRLLGVAMRTHNPLSLDLPSFFWKPLVGAALTRRDLEQVDHSVCHSWDAIAAMSEEDFNAAVFETFQVALSDGTRVSLPGHAADEPVTFAQRSEFLRLATAARLAESSQQMAAVLRGLASLVPVGLLRMLEWRDLEVRVCGRGQLDLALLKRHTQYRAGVAATDQHVLWFWQVLEEFSEEEKRLFLRFAWGRERLPPEEELAHEEMKIFPLLTDKDPDALLPTAETCFFNVKLPRYTSVGVLRSKLLYAILHTRTIDGDLAHSN